MPSQFDWNFSRFIFFDDIPNEMTRLTFWEKQANSTNPSSANFVFSMLNVKIGHKTEKENESQKLLQLSINKGYTSNGVNSVKNCLLSFWTMWQL